MMWATKIMDVLLALEKVLMISLCLLLGTLAGLFITGILPAAEAALYTIQRMLQDHELGVLALAKLFYQRYRTQWRPLLKLSIINTIGSLVLLLDWYAVLGLKLPLLWPLLVITPYYGMVMLNLLLLKGSDQPTFQHLKQALVLPFAFFGRYIGVLAVFVLAAVISLQVSPIIGAALPGVYLVGIYYALPVKLTARATVSQKERQAWN
ncbi:DUF624 domain-containing protein [Schleiferilactobacillus harbinensis]|jgi:uncharacterized membrane protein YesL|uniref:DUF624 domain-containing protein n=2 Tax=Schleiferilactobacillus harbinensis TaxID=304207 RepID=UPI0011BE01CA|nr:DUF624 domain-containing protein [Schleiferilactobacillus harbinensis]